MGSSSYFYKIFIILDCPSPSYIPSLLKSEQYRKIQKSKENTPVCVIHMAGEGVLEDERYKEWMSEFPAQTKHILCSPSWNCPEVIFQDSARSHAKLGQLDSRIFPPIYYRNEPQRKASSLGLGDRAVQARPCMIYQMEPKPKLDLGEVTKPYIRRQFSPSSSPQFSPRKRRNSLEYALGQVPPPSPPQKRMGGDDVVISTLGTGSSIPCKYRNVSATLITIPETKATMLMDVGEGTYGQLWRHLGEEGGTNPLVGFSTDEALRNLTCIYISHMHADHHLGLVRILVKRKEALERLNSLRTGGTGTRNRDVGILHIVGPHRLWSWIREYAEVEDVDMDRLRFTCNQDLLDSGSQGGGGVGIRRVARQALLQDLGLKEIQTAEVIHCPWSYGLSMTFPDWKFV